MSGNRVKDTAGRTLIGFSLLVAGVVAMALRDWWGREHLEGARYPTAVEDTRYYVGLGPDDFSEPNLRFWAAPGGLVRADREPRTLRDFRMRKLVDPLSGHFTWISTGRDPDEGHFVYWYEKDGLDPVSGLPRQVYLKVADDRYVRFGAPGAGGVQGSDSGLRGGGETVTASALSPP
jgi:hypothetical protein